MTEYLLILTILGHPMGDTLGNSSRDAQVTMERFTSLSDCNRAGGRASRLLDDPLVTVTFECLEVVKR